MKPKTAGQIAYEAAAKATNCKQNWNNANKAKWEAAARAVISLEARRLDGGNYDYCGCPHCSMLLDVTSIKKDERKKVLEEINGNKR